MMIYSYKYSSLTLKMFDNAKKVENILRKKCTDVTKYAGFTDKNEFLIVGNRFYYLFNELQSEEKKNLQKIFLSDWKNELYYGFDKFYVTTNKQKNFFHVLMLLGMNPDKLTAIFVEEAKNVGFKSDKSVYCPIDKGNFLYKRSHLLGTFAPISTLATEVRSKYPFEHTFSFEIQKVSNFPKKWAFFKAILLTPFMLLYDLLAVTLLYGTLFLVSGILRIRDFLGK